MFFCLVAAAIVASSSSWEIGDVPQGIREREYVESGNVYTKNAAGKWSLKCASAAYSDEEEDTQCVAVGKGLYPACETVVSTKGIIIKGCRDISTVEMRDAKAKCVVGELPKKSMEICFCITENCNAEVPRVKKSWPYLF